MLHIGAMSRVSSLRIRVIATSVGHSTQEFAWRSSGRHRPRVGRGPAPARQPGVSIPSTAVSNASTLFHGGRGEGYPDPMTSHRTSDDGAGAALAVLATFVAGALLVLIRGHVDNSVTVLVARRRRVAPVRRARRLAGRRRGAPWRPRSRSTSSTPARTCRCASTTPTTSSPRRRSSSSGAIAGITVVGRRTGAQDRAVEASDELAAVERVADLVADGADPADVETAVRAELLDLLRPVDCRCDRRAAPTTMPVLGRGGALAGSVPHLPRRRLRAARPAASPSRCCGAARCVRLPRLHAGARRRRLRRRAGARR